MQAENPTPPGAAPGPPSTGGRTIPREHDAPRALIVLMILLMLGSVAAAFHWIQRNGVAEQVVGRPAPFAAEGPIYTLAEIVSEEVKGNLLGRDVALWGAPVQRVAGDWLFWVGDSADAVPVVLLGEQTARQSEQQTTVRPGDVLAVFGTIHAVRRTEFLEGPRTLPQIERREIARAGVYISALRVERITPAD